MSTHMEGANIHVSVTAHAILSLGAVHLSLTVREGTDTGIWRYNLSHGTDRHAASGRISEMTDHMDALKNAAAACSTGYQPGTPTRGLLEQFAAGAIGHRPVARRKEDGQVEESRYVDSRERA